jgi:hypothetical protein
LAVEDLLNSNFKLKAMKNYIIEDDRTTDEVNNTLGFVVATDKFMSGWGKAAGRSYVAVPFVSEEDKYKVLSRINRRSEMKRVREVYGKTYRPSMRSGDHLHIYNTKNSFRYAL